MVLSPIYLYTGPELGEKNDAILKIQKSVESSFGELDVHSFYAYETSISYLSSLLGNGSLFSGARFVVLRNAELIKKKEDIELLSSWLSTARNLQGKNDAFLVLVSDDNSVDKKLEKLVSKENTTIFWELFENRKEQWLVSWFSKHELSIESDAVETILEMVENNTDALRRECSRFPLCFEKHYRITSLDVENLLSHNREESAFTLFNALCDPSKSCEKRLENGLSILQKIRHSKSSSGVQLIAGLTYCFRKVRIWHSLHTGKRPSEFDLKINGFASKKAQKQYRDACFIWGLRESVAILALLSTVDMHIRSNGTSCEENDLQMLLYCLVMKNGFPLEACDPL